MSTESQNENTLFYGDNLEILREYIPSESVDFVYLDPPFNSNRSYNVLFTDESGNEAEAQITAFEDTWHWGQETEKTYHEIVQNAAPHIVTMMSAFREFIGTNQMMAYLVMMTARLIELHRVLRTTGSIYLHCDPTASHYLKVVLDGVFGPANFRNEIVWRRTGAHNKIRRYAPIHDVILFYTKSQDYTWTYPKRPYMRGHVEENFIREGDKYRTDYYGNVLTGSGTRNGESGKPWKGFDPTAKGRHWAIPGALIDDIDEDLSKLGQHEKLDRLYELGHIKIVEGQAWPIYERYISEKDGQAISDILAFQPYTSGTVFGTELGIDEDIRWLSPKDQERLGYPTQKPLSLLERLIEASSNKGDLVLDPFCGCGTAVVAAQKLGRRWIGIDITHLSISLMKYRLRDNFNLKEGVDYKVIGEPQDLADAKQLAQQDRYQFQWWALSLIQAKPLGGDGGKQGKKGSDKGIDGVLHFVDAKSKLEKVLIQVKSGKVGSGDIRDLRGAVDRENAALGIFVTLEDPTRDMNTEAVSAGFFHSSTWDEDYPKIQILTVEDLLNGGNVNMPPSAYGTFKQAKRIKKKDGSQDKLF